MRMRTFAVIGWTLAAWAALPAFAQDYQLHGFADVRVVSAGGEPNWTKGGLGKLRWDGSRSGAQFGGAALQGTAQFASEWFGLASVQYQTTDRSGASLIEGWLRYRPVSTSPWRWSLKAGAFFPPVSLENTGIAWTSPYTLTPSAIDTWVGEELRSKGVEVRIEHRGDALSVESAFAVFVGNDPAGEQMAARGWSLSDRVYGLGDSLREPDLASFDGPPPRRFDPFVETDHRPGWYAQLRLDSPTFGQWNLMRYDNRANPSSATEFDGQEIYSWHTRFWSFGAQKQVGETTLIAQGMNGDTMIVPSPFFRTRTNFWSAYLLASREFGQWQPTLRVEAFGTHVHPGLGPFPSNEHGRALTAALNWRPRSWLRITGEVLAIDSSRPERGAEGRSARGSEVQTQLGFRFSF